MFRSLSAVRSLAGDVDDLERFHHLFLPGGRRSVQSKEYIFLSLFQTAATAPPPLSAPSCYTVKVESQIQIWDPLIQHSD